MNFSAVILAGGQSSRMGRDKAFLEVDGQTLLARQIQTARAAGATEVFISGRPNADYSSFGSRVLIDAFPDSGPLGGIERAFATATEPLVLVLAVDLPKMESGFLHSLAAQCTEAFGIIPASPRGLEPLAAFYTRSAHPTCLARLKDRQLKVSDFAMDCIRQGQMRTVQAAATHNQCFNNLNKPKDFQACCRNENNCTA